MSELFSILYIADISMSNPFNGSSLATAKIIFSVLNPNCALL